MALKDHIRFCPYCAVGFELPDGYTGDSCPGCKRAEVLTTQIEELERERDYWRMLPGRDLADRAEKAELALAKIEISEPDWAKGVDENCEVLRSIARAALRPSEKASDES